MPERLTAFVGPPGGALDPALAQEGQGLVVALNALEGLLIPDPSTLEPNPGVADLPEVSSDGRTVTFKLREGREWADGRPVLAEDFVRGWRRALRLQREGPLPPALAQIGGAQEAWLGGLVISNLPSGLDERAVASALLPYGAVADVRFREGGRTAIVLPSREAIRLEGIPGPPDREALCGWVRRVLPRDLTDARCSLAHGPGGWRALVRLPAVRQAGDLERARRSLAVAGYRGRPLDVVVPTPEEVIDEAIRSLDGSLLGFVGQPVRLDGPGDPIRVRRAGPEDLGVRAVDARTLEVNLRAPAEEWLAIVPVAPQLLPWPADVDAVEEALRRGNGAFPLESVAPDGTVVLRTRGPAGRNPRHIVLVAAADARGQGRLPTVVAEGPPWPGRESAAVTSRGAATGLGANQRGIPLFRALWSREPTEAGAETGHRR